jgi:hypothetical protein
MPEHLRETLADLHRELAATEAIDAELDSELRATLEEIRAKLAGDEALEQPLLERVRDLMLRFEGAHPTLSEAVGRVVQTLARLGI